MNSPPNLKLLQASVDPDDESEFRLLVDGRFIKYITIDTGLYDVDDMCFEPSLIQMLPPLPVGDWNTSRISLNPETGVPYFAAVARKELAGVANIWHPLKIDYLDLQMGKKLRTNVYEATCASFDGTVVAKFALFPWEVPYLDSETQAYKWIEGHHIGPAFLGHLTEEGRVIGFITTRVVNFQHATMADYDSCHSALSRLHKLGIKHGDINKHNFLIQDGKATLIDFDNASLNASAKELQEELQGLEKELKDTSGRGGRIVERS